MDFLQCSKWQTKINAKGCDFISKNKVLILISAVLVGISCVAIICHIRGETIIQYPNTNYLPNGTPSRSLSFSLIGSSHYDPVTHTGKNYTLEYNNGASIMEIGGFIVEGTLVEWVHIRDSKAMRLVAESNQIKDSFEVDFNEHDLIISFGREITEMQCYYYDHFGAPEGPEVLAVTYSGTHHGSKVFYYQIPKTNIVYYELMAPYYCDGEWGSGWGNTGTIIDWERARQAGYGNGK